MSLSDYFFIDFHIRHNRHQINENECRIIQRMQLYRFPVVRVSPLCRVPCYRLTASHHAVRVTHRVTFAMGHAGESRESPNDVVWETLSLRLRRPISAPLLTVVRAPVGYLHTPDSCSVMEIRIRRPCRSLHLALIFTFEWIWWLGPQLHGWIHEKSVRTISMNYSCWFLLLSQSPQPPTHTFYLESHCGLGKFCDNTR